MLARLGSNKFELVVGLEGHRFSTVLLAGETTQVAGFSPEICALSGLIVVPCAQQVLTCIHQAKSAIAWGRRLTGSRHPLPVPDASLPSSHTPRSEPLASTVLGLADKFAGDKPEKLVLEDGATHREAGLLHGQVAEYFSPWSAVNDFASVADASRPKA